MLFFSRKINRNKVKHHAVEKEAAAIVEAIREWRHFLLGRHFKLITDQKSISYMYNGKRKSKIKNDKISRWRVELSRFKFDKFEYRPGKENLTPDTFSRVGSVNHHIQELKDLHEKLCHPGVTRLAHFIHSKNYPYTLEQVRQVTASCKSCLFLKPQFLRTQSTLIQAMLPFQRINIDFKGLLPFKGPLPKSANGNQYLLSIINEFS